MTDDLVRRLRCYADIDDAVYHPWVYGESADRIEKLEALVEQLRDDNSSLIDSFDKDFLRQEARIEKLEAALRGVISVADRDCPEFRFARKALEIES